MKQVKSRLNDLDGKEWVKSTKSWFLLENGPLSKNLDKSWLVVDGKPKDIPTEIRDHPASFPPELIEKFILFFTKKGQFVLDPFLGIGSTLEACYNTDRNGIGIELVKKYADYSKKRVQSLLEGRLIRKNLRLQVINANASKISELVKKHNIPKIDLCITSPPYWDMLHKTRGNVKSVLKTRIENGFDQIYSKDKEDFGNIRDYNEYLKKISTLFGEMYDILNDKAHIIIILQNVRTPEGIMKPVAWDVAREISKRYRLLQEFIWVQNQKFLGCWGYPSVYVSNVHHHYCLVFQKGVRRTDA